MKGWDLIIIGGGIVGCSVAHHVLQKANWRVLILEREADVGTGATSKATGGIRHQFSTEANIRLTQLSYPYFTHAEELIGRPVDFIRHGYLFVTTENDRLAIFRSDVALQRRLGVNSSVITPQEMKPLFPQLYTDDLYGGAYCPDDGSADPYGTLQGFLARARERGCRVQTSEPVIAIIRAVDRVTGVETPGGRYEAPMVLDAAGPFADQVAALAGVDLPSKPYRRQVMVAEPLPEMPEIFPLTVDSDTGWYVHRQGKSALLMGGTDKESHPGIDTTVDWGALEPVMRAAAKRVPALEGVPIIRAYAGLRDLTPDYHGILGPVPHVPGFYVACGFSGHGFMHSPAIGILVAELLVDGRAKSMDVTPLSYERFLGGYIHPEANIF